MDFSSLPRGLPGSKSASGAEPRQQWMHPDTITQSEFWSVSPSKIFLGRINGEPFGADDDRHLTTIAGSRTGKGTSAIVPNLLNYSGSVLVLDPKGENAALTAKSRAKYHYDDPPEDDPDFVKAYEEDTEHFMLNGIERHGDKFKIGGEVFVIDPFDVSGVPDELKAGWNPFDWLDPENPNFIDDCDLIADSLILAPADKINDHWNSSARRVLRGFVAWVAATHKKPNMAEMVRLLTLPWDDDAEEGSLTALLGDMMDSQAAQGIPAEMAATLHSMADGERGSVMSTVHQNITFLSSPPMREILAGEMRSPDLARWKYQRDSIYLCLPASRLHQHSRFFRLFINQLLLAVQTYDTPPFVPALMILDEMHVLGHMNQLAVAAGLVAGYGVRLWSFWQDLNQLAHHYGNLWETFIGNSGLLQVFGVSDYKTLEYISKKLGNSTYLHVNQSEISAQQAAQGFSGTAEQVHKIALLEPHEIEYFFSRQSGNQLLLRPGNAPIFAQRAEYWNDPYFQRMIEE